MWAAVLGVAATTGACPTGPDWCYRSPVNSVKYVTAGPGASAITADALVAGAAYEFPAKELSILCASIDNYRSAMQQHIDEGVYDGLALGVDKRILDWVDACGTPISHHSTLAPPVVCNASSMACGIKNHDGSTTPVANCESATVEVIDCRRGADDDRL